MSDKTYRVAFFEVEGYDVVCDTITKFCNNKEKSTNDFELISQSIIQINRHNGYDAEYEIHLIYTYTDKKDIPSSIKEFDVDIIDSYGFEGIELMIKDYWKDKELLYKNLTLVNCSIIRVERNSGYDDKYESFLTYSHEGEIEYPF